MEDYVYCLECDPPRKFKQITSTHLKKAHNITVEEYLKRHPDADLVCQSVREKLVDANKAKWSDPNYKVKVAKAISDVISQQWEDGKYPRTQTEEHKRMKNAAQSKTMRDNPRFGRDAGNWQGGLSFIPYCEKFNGELKDRIRSRDKYTCQLCGVHQDDFHRKLDVHHIHYDKENCDPDLITLCMKCNLKVNGNRDYWEAYFMANLWWRRLVSLED